MLHAKVIDIIKEKIELSNAEKFIASSKCVHQYILLGLLEI